MEDSLTIIVPIYNEEECLPPFFAEMDDFIKTCPISILVLCINDGSTDASPVLIRNKCDEDSHYTTIFLDTNRGLSAAIKAGLDHCTTSLVGYIDADLQTHPSDFLSYLKYFPRYDMVNGIRQNRKDTVVKRLSSKIANNYRRFMIRDNIEDSCCPLKIIKTDMAKQIPFFTGMHRFIPALIQLHGGLVKQLPITHSPRYGGTAKYNLRNRLIGPFFDTLAFRWMRSRHISYTVASVSNQHGSNKRPGHNKQ